QLLAKNGSDPGHEVQLIRKDGSIAELWVSSTVHRDPITGAREILSVSRDLTAQRRAEAALAQSRDYLEQSQRLGRTGYIVSDRAMQQVTWSDTMFEIRGVAPRPWFSFPEALAFIHPEDRPAFDAARQTCVAERRPYELELRVVCPDGRIIWEHSIGHPQF